MDSSPSPQSQSPRATEKRQPGQPNCQGGASATQRGHEWGRRGEQKGDLGMWRGRKGYRAGGRGHVRFPPCYPQSLSQSRNFYNIIFHSALH